MKKKFFPTIIMVGLGIFYFLLAIAGWQGILGESFPYYNSIYGVVENILIGGCFILLSLAYYHEARK